MEGMGEEKGALLRTDSNLAFLHIHRYSGVMQPYRNSATLQISRR